MRRQDAEAKAEIEGGLLAGLGRAPTMADRLAVEQIAALTVLARVLERRGKLQEAGQVRDQIVRAQRTNGLKPQPIEPAKPVDPMQALRDYAARQSEPTP
ncbi:hypothetical protein [Bradyrhizobium sp. 6(2017)]|uniref:hypothetical protein n=1 Tax=Bradyrhizobium sp. 6(2017) TaxID=1197460 RepID=UPI0013E1233C|nr:hypothetical protein [Bradyrhizobium sp. 6(2017)]QIG94415.1 hypothetical protein G6P99_19335 [Bradyrhizobium sp. 6(2017)]